MKFIAMHTFDRDAHQQGTAAWAGACSWHGTDTCHEKPVASFTWPTLGRQSGCLRAVVELSQRPDVLARFCETVSR